MPAPTVLVTGASSGIGAETARLLLERGWRVFAAARRLEAMEPLAASPSARKVDASPSRPLFPPGGLMEQSNASLQRGRQG